MSCAVIVAGRGGVLSSDFISRFIMLNSIIVFLDFVRWGSRSSDIVRALVVVWLGCLPPGPARPIFRGCRNLRGTSLKAEMSIERERRSNQRFLSREPDTEPAFTIE